MNLICQSAPNVLGIVIDELSSYSVWHTRLFIFQIIHKKFVLIKTYLFIIYEIAIVLHFRCQINQDKPDFITGKNRIYT